MEETVFVEESAAGQREDVVVDGGARVLPADEVGADHRAGGGAVDRIHRIVEALIGSNKKKRIGDIGQSMMKRNRIRLEL